MLEHSGFAARAAGATDEAACAAQNGCLVVCATTGDWIDEYIRVDKSPDHGRIHQVNCDVIFVTLWCHIRDVVTSYS